MTPREPVAKKIETTFHRDCSVRCDIHAKPAEIWALLTDARRFTSWNSTVRSLEGDISLGNKLALKVKLDPTRTFTPRVTKLEFAKEMEWSDGFEEFARDLRRAAEGGAR